MFARSVLHPGATASAAAAMDGNSVNPVHMRLRRIEDLPYAKKPYLILSYRVPKNRSAVTAAPPPLNQPREAANDPTLALLYFDASGAGGPEATGGGGPASSPEVAVEVGDGSGFGSGSGPSPPQPA
jgi:hypothetical protein